MSEKSRHFYKALKAQLKVPSHSYARTVCSGAYFVCAIGEPSTETIP